MSSNLPPVPVRVPMLDLNGNLSQMWADWFQKVFVRVGGNISYTNDELYPVTPERIPDESIIFSKLQNINSDRLIGRDSASIGDPEEITVGGGLEWTGAGGIQSSAYTGDVTKSAGGTVQSIANSSLAFAKFLSSDWSNSKASIGYLKLPSGLYIQWGVTGSIGSGTNTSVSFPIAFPSSCAQVIPGIQGNSAAATTTTGQWGTGNYSTAGFDLYNRTSSPFTFNWVAVGY